jgi:xanthine dehydrogenase YagR molybdenum-binding subunit
MANTSPVGQPLTRIDAPKKVSGAAPYSIEQKMKNLAFAAAVSSTIGNGRIASIDTSDAERMPGVLAILHHGNVGRLYRPAGSLEEMSRPGESRPPFEDENIYYFGQYVALVVADTFEQAQDAAAHVKVTYDSQKPLVRLSQPPIRGQVGTSGDTKGAPPNAQHSRGNAETAYQQAPVKVDYTYVTPIETHNPMEMHGTVAVWEGDRLTLYESSQGVVNHHNVASQVLGMPPENIEVISRFIGSGFGCKLFPWPHSWLAAVAAKKVQRPVQFALPRTLMFTSVGHRPTVEQHIRIGATQDGELTALINDIRNSTSFVDEYLEDCVDPTSMLYSCPNVSAVQCEIKLNTGTPTPMRGPGRTPALFGLESALDDLAIKLNIDPLEIRLRNYAEQDEGSKKPWSSKHLREAYQLGAQKFGWSKRNPKVGSMRSGDEILGWGMATCTWPAHQRGAEVRVRLLSDGSAQASCATQDIGTGTYSVFAAIVSDRTGIPFDRISVILGDSSLPPGPTSGGSAATASVVPAVAQATDKAIAAVLKAATTADKSPFSKADPKTLKLTAGRVHAADKSPDSGVPFQEILAMKNLVGLDGQAKSNETEEQRKFSTHSFGAHFCEISFDAGVLRLRVTRWVTVMDGGRMINEKTARNQIIGGVVMGIGMGLFEETIYDPRNGKPINNNYADYLVPVNADIPLIDVTFLDYPDKVMSEYGARGVGEIGLTGCASALTMATYHATGVRVRELPIRIEKLVI